MLDQDGYVSTNNIRDSTGHYAAPNARAVRSSESGYYDLPDAMNAKPHTDLPLKTSADPRAVRVGESRYYDMPDTKAAQPHGGSDNTSDKHAGHPEAHAHANDGVPYAVIGDPSKSRYDEVSELSVVDYATAEEIHSPKYSDQERTGEQPRNARSMKRAALEGGVQYDNVDSAAGSDALLPTTNDPAYTKFKDTTLV